MSPQSPDEGSRKAERSARSRTGGSDESRVAELIAFYSANRQAQNVPAAGGTPGAREHVGGPPEQREYVTRSGRISRPPVRFPDEELRQDVRPGGETIAKD